MSQLKCPFCDKAIPLPPLPSLRVAPNNSSYRVMNVEFECECGTTLHFKIVKGSKPKKSFKIVKGSKPKKPFPLLKKL